MGCAQSKIENEEAVSRCKERKQFMKEAVRSRNAFAAAHAGFTVSLKQTGSALSDYAEGEILDNHLSISSSSILPSSQLPLPPNPLPPPPPLPNFPHIPPLQRAASMPEFKPKPFSHTKPTSTIHEEDEEDEDDDDESNHLSHHRRRRSSTSKAGGIEKSVAKEEEEEEGPPPLPSPPREQRPTNPIPPPPESTTSTWDYIFPSVHDMPMSSLNEVDEIQSFKDDNFGGLKRSQNENFRVDDVVSTSNNNTTTTTSTNFSEDENQMAESVVEPTTAKQAKRPNKQNLQSNSMPTEAKRVAKMVPGVSLLRTLKELDEYFLEASQSCNEVSRILETNRLHYHSNFADNRGHIDHSRKVMRVITWNRSFRGLQEPDDQDDDVDTHETLASVLDKLLAWEKKLYDEVKVGEVMKFEYQKKMSLLNKQMDRGASVETQEKTKAAVSHLHTRLIVDIQSLDSTVSEVNSLRDDHLYPKLVLLVDGMAEMWGNMNIHHRAQMKKVEELKFLDISQVSPETTEEHHRRTIQFWNVLGDWHSQFQKLMIHKKEYIKALNSWLKLNLIPIESSLKEKVSSPPRIPRPPIQYLLLAWQEHLENLPNELARSEISSFAHKVEAIMTLQEEEVNMRTKCEETRKELSRKTRSFEDWYHKHMTERSENPNQKDPVVERQFIVETLKQRLEQEEEDLKKHSGLVRDKSLVTFKTHLPKLFRVMSDFSLDCALTYKKLQSVAHSQKNTARNSS